MNQQAPQLLDPDTAYAIVHQRVYSPVFFEKLASDYGIRPQSEQEAMEMLTMAGQLRSAHEVQRQKAAAANNPLAAARAHLDKQLVKLGMAPQNQNNVVMERRIKAAAAQTSFDPEIAHAIMSMQAAANGVSQEHLAAV